MIIEEDGNTVRYTVVSVLYHAAGLSIVATVSQGFSP